MKNIKVAAGMILKGNEIFAAQRGYGEFKGGWEFPGGKIEHGETPQEALKREISEELDMDIEVGMLFDTVEYDYPEFHLKLYCFFCKIKSGNLILKEYTNSKWLTKENIDSVEWLAANRGLIEKLKKWKWL